MSQSVRRRASENISTPTRSSRQQQIYQYSPARFAPEPIPYLNRLSSSRIRQPNFNEEDENEYNNPNIQNIYEEKDEKENKEYDQAEQNQNLEDQDEDYSLERLYSEENEYKEGLYYYNHDIPMLELQFTDWNIDFGKILKAMQTTGAVLAGSSALQAVLKSRYSKFLQSSLQQLNIPVINENLNQLIYGEIFRGSLYPTGFDLEQLGLTTDEYNQYISVAGRTDETYNFPSGLWKSDFDFWVVHNPDRWLDPVEVFYPIFYAAGYRHLQRFNPENSQYDRLKKYVKRIHTFGHVDDIENSGFGVRMRSKNPKYPPIQVMVLYPGESSVPTRYKNEHRFGRYSCLNRSAERYPIPDYITTFLMVQSFDITVCQFVYDGVNLYSLVPLTDKIQVSEKAAQEQTPFEWTRTIDRIDKYSKRGFAPDWNNIQQAVLTTLQSFMQRTVERRGGVGQLSLQCIRELRRLLDTSIYGVNRSLEQIQAPFVLKLGSIDESTGEFSAIIRSLGIVAVAIMDQSSGQVLFSIPLPMLTITEEQLQEEQAPPIRGAGRNRRSSGRGSRRGSIQSGRGSVSRNFPPAPPPDFWQEETERCNVDRIVDYFKREKLDIIITDINWWMSERQPDWESLMSGVLLDIINFYNQLNDRFYSYDCIRAIRLSAGDIVNSVNNILNDRNIPYHIERGFINPENQQFQPSDFALGSLFDPRPIAFAVIDNNNNIINIKIVQNSLLNEEQLEQLRRVFPNDFLNEEELLQQRQQYMRQLAQQREEAAARLAEQIERGEIQVDIPEPEEMERKMSGEQVEQYARRNNVYYLATSGFQYPDDWSFNPSDLTASEEEYNNLVNTAQCYDIINIDNIQFQEYIDQNPQDNVIIITPRPSNSSATFGPNALCYSRSDLRDLLNDLTAQSLPCVGQEDVRSHSYFPADASKRFIKINLGDQTIYVPEQEIINIANNRNNNRIYQAEATNLILPVTASSDALIEGNFVSADHCQAGTQKTIYHLRPVRIRQI